MNGPQHHFIIVSSVLLALLYFGLAARIVTRVYIIKGFTLDDVFACLGVVFATLFVAFPIAAMQYGFGEVIPEKVFEDSKPYQLLMLGSTSSYTLATTFFKLALLMLYIRLFKHQSMIYFTYALAFVIAGLGIGFLVATWTMCIPLSMLWHPLQAGKCFSIVNLYYASSLLYILTDFATFLLPIKSLWQLQLPLQQRIGLCSLFGVGLLASVAGIVKVCKLNSLVSSSTTTSDILVPVEWSIVEICLAGFLCGVPTMKALFRRVKPERVKPNLLSPESSPSSNSESKKETYSVPGSISGRSEALSYHDIH